MKTKEKTLQKQKTSELPPITNTTRQEIGQNISFALDLMNDPRFKEENFRQIVDRSMQSYSLSATNEEVFISFTINWKGGKR